jgi:DNA-binding NtrC family response regulator
MNPAISCEQTSPHPRMLDSRVEANPSRVLVVDDDRDLFPIFRRAVAALDGDVRLDWATSVTDGLVLLDTRSYEFVVSDYLLRDGTGFELQRWRDRRIPERPFGMISVVPLADVQLVTQGGRARTLFLSKPFTLGDLRQFLQILRAAVPDRPMQD